MLDRRPNLGMPNPQRPGLPMVPGQGYVMPPQRQPGTYPQLAYSDRFYHSPNRYRNPSNNNPLYQPPPPSYRLPNTVPLHTNSRRRGPTNSGHYPQYWQRPPVAQQPETYPDPVPDPVADPVPNIQDSETVADEEESSNTRREAIIVDRPLPESVGETAWRTRGFGPCTKSCAEGVSLKSAEMKTWRYSYIS